MRTAVVILVLLVAHRASADMCGQPGVVEMTAKLEQRARLAKPEAETIDVWATCLRDMHDSVPADSALPVRLLAACTRLLDKIPEDPLCIEVAARLGKAELGGHDIVAAIAKQPNRLEDARPNDLIAAIGAPRGAAVVMARWKQLVPAAAQKERDADAMNSWAAWRLSATAALGITGDADARGFLEEQAKATIDRGVKRACAAAIAAIDKRHSR
jgi:hypothetical protein